MVTYILHLGSPVFGWKKWNFCKCCPVALWECSYFGLISLPRNLEISQLFLLLHQLLYLFSWKTMQVTVLCTLCLVFRGFDEADHWECRPVGEAVERAVRDAAVYFQFLLHGKVSWLLGWWWTRSDHYRSLHGPHFCDSCEAHRKRFYWSLASLSHSDCLAHKIRNQSWAGGVHHYS